MIKGFNRGRLLTRLDLLAQVIELVRAIRVEPPEADGEELHQLLASQRLN